MYINKNYNNTEDKAVAFGISEGTTSYFINNKIELPRFQRKATWKENDNFKLCISVFKGYPIGVIIVNEMGKEGKKYLLDGRQRRNALLSMYQNPVKIYEWAQKFIGLKSNMQEAEVRDKFAEKIHMYLQSEFENTTEEDETSENESDYVPTFDIDLQSANMHALLELILLVHGKFKGTNTFEGIFKFDKIIHIEELDYSNIVNADYVIDPIKLKKFIKSRIENDETSKQDFFLYLKKRHKLDDKSSKTLEKYLDNHWSYFERCFDVIRKTDEIIVNARIGLIRLIDASPLDAQNIFSLVNSGGAPLTAEELLSSRPFWNVEVSNPSDEVRDEAKKLYDYLGISIPSNIVRWDVCATLMSRIDKDHLIFSDFDLSDPKSNNFTRKLTLGFKLISAIKVGGISSNSVKELENEKKIIIDWEKDIEELVKNFSIMINLLSDCDYFKYMMAWKQSVMSLTSNSVALEFATLLYKKWLVDLDKPLKSNVAKVKEFQKCAIVLYDRLVYEYSSRLWAGSSDSRLARDLTNAHERFIPVENIDWEKVINIFAEGENSSVVKGIIYHFYCIRKMVPTLSSGKTKYEIDHIYAQAQFAGAVTIDKKLMNSLGNYALLPKDENIAKSDRSLVELESETWLFEQIKKYTDIKNEDVKKYSDITNIHALICERIDLYKKVFSEERNSLLNN